MENPVNPNVVRQYEHETWTRCAETYLDHFAGLTCQTVPILRDAADIGPGTSVLDIGSGPGHVAGTLAQTGATVTGIDFSAKMVEVARLKYPQAKFQEADAEQLPFEDASFDAVVSNFVVHHLARPDIVFGEVFRVLKPGDRFAFVVFERPEAQSSIGAFFDAVAKHHDMDDLPHGPLFGAERSAYIPPLNTSGLTDTHFATHDIVWQSDTLDPVVQAFLEWGNIARLSEDIQKKIEATARENLRSYRHEAGYAFPHTVLLGIAKKPGSQ